MPQNQTSRVSRRNMIPIKLLGKTAQAGRGSIWPPARTSPILADLKQNPEDKDSLPRVKFACLHNVCPLGSRATLYCQFYRQPESGQPVQPSDDLKTGRAALNQRPLTSCQNARATGPPPAGKIPTHKLTRKNFFFNKRDDQKPGRPPQTKSPWPPGKTARATVRQPAGNIRTHKLTRKIFFVN